MALALREGTALAAFDTVLGGLKAQRV